MTAFDDAAKQFTASIDHAIASNTYTRGRVIMDLIARVVPRGSFVLDYGCGPGRLAYLVAKGGWRVHGVDTSRAMIDSAHELDGRGLGVSFAAIETAAEALPAGAYDAILCSSVIEYVVDPAGLLGLFHHSLRPSGVLIISYANSTSLFRRAWEKKAEANPMYTPHNHTWNWSGFKGLLGKHGFKPLGSPRYFDSPCDWHPCGRLFAGFALAGSIGLVAARRV